MKRHLAALAALLLAASLSAVAAAQEEGPFDPEAVLKKIGLPHGAGAGVMKKLDAITAIERSFHRKRIAKEIAYAGRFSGQESVGLLSKEIFALAATEQKKIDSLANEIRRLLPAEARTRFAGVELPDLTDAGTAVFGAFRPPGSDDEIAQWKRAERRTPPGAPTKTPDFCFSHDTHPDIKNKCTNCHRTKEKSKIEEEFRRFRALLEGRNARPRGLRPRRTEHMPVMERCLECHNDQGAVNECSLCHPGLERAESILSRSANPFELLKIGVPAPPFTLSGPERKRFSLKTFLKKKRFLLLQFGSSTCPSYLRQAAGTASLAEKHDKEPVTFVTVYTAEAHPEIIAGDKWLPKNRKEMWTRAEVCRDTLARQGVIDKTLLLVDAWPGKVSALYGGCPNSVFIISPSGKIAWKAERAKTDELAAALQELLWKHH